MMKRRGVRLHTNVPVYYSLECPLHPNGVIEYPVGASANLSVEKTRFYCVSGNHQVNEEDIRIICYSPHDGTTVDTNASGVLALSVLATL
jgi:hypothetical protein